MKRLFLFLDRYFSWKTRWLAILLIGVGTRAPCTVIVQALVYYIDAPNADDLTQCERLAWLVTDWKRRG